MSTQPTEAHRELVREMAHQGQYLNRSIKHYAQLLADSEARAVEDAVAKIIEANAPEIAKTNAALTTLEIELARLRAEVERLTKQIKDDNRAYGCELRDPNGTIWEQAAKDHARAERAEAEIERWRDSNNRLRAEMELQAQRAERSEAECLEQARLLGKSGEREADLLGKIFRLQSIIDRASTQFFHEGTDGEILTKMLTILNESK